MDDLDLQLIRAFRRDEASPNPVARQAARDQIATAVGSRRLAPPGRGRVRGGLGRSVWHRRWTVLSVAFAAVAALCALWALRAERSRSTEAAVELQTIVSSARNANVGAVTWVSAGGQHWTRVVYLTRSHAHGALRDAIFAGWLPRALKVWSVHPAKRPQRVYRLEEVRQPHRIQATCREPASARDCGQLTFPVIQRSGHAVTTVRSKHAVTTAAPPSSGASVSVQGGGDEAVQGDGARVQSASEGYAVVEGEEEGEEAGEG